ncbi:MAG: DUF5658 family protein [Pseudomonadota bacterium]
MLAKIAPVPGTFTLPSRLAVVRTLLVALAVAQVFDILSTNAALAASPLAFEGNPLMRFVMRELGSYWWAWKAGIAVFFLGYAACMKIATKRDIVLLGIMVKTYVLVIASNMMGWF